MTYTGLYIQDEYAVNSRFNITAGIRFDIPFFGDTGFRNPNVESLTFIDEDGDPYQTRTDQLPDPNLLVSPRLGFNWDVFGNQTTQLRGGTGLFTGRPPFVWISNQIGNNGVLTGFIQEDATTNFPFSPDPTTFLPDDPSAFLPSTVQLASTDPDFKFPQIWRTNIAVDQKLPWGLVATAEFIYNKNVNGILYIDGNREAATGTFPGPDNRPQFPGIGLSGSALNNALRINDNVSDNTTLTNTSEGFSYSLTFQLEKTFDNGFYAKLAYNYAKSKDLLSAGSIASGSFTRIDAVRGNNDPDLAFSNNDQRHRIIGAFSYRKEYGDFGASEISLFYNAFNQNRYTYTYNGDMNGDGIFGNDLLFVPEDVADLNFEPNGDLSSTIQANAFNAFIEADPYLRERRGQYVERNGAFLPWLSRIDLTFIQEFFVNVKEKRNTLQFRIDILNFGNLLNSNWGVSQSLIQSSPLRARGVVTQTDVDNGVFGADRLGQPKYSMATTNLNGITVPVLSENIRYNANIDQVWQLQFSLRYIFN